MPRARGSSLEIRFYSELKKKKKKKKHERLFLFCETSRVSSHVFLCSEKESKAEKNENGRKEERKRKEEKGRKKNFRED